jgi:nucleoside-diphosphate-sugar epimerase
MRVLIANVDRALGFAIAKRLLRQRHTVYGLSSLPVSSWKTSGIRVLSDDLSASATRAALRMADAVIAPDIPLRGLSGRFRYADLRSVQLCRAIAGSERIFVASGNVGILGDTGSIPVPESAPVPRTRGNMWLRRLEDEIHANNGIVIRPARLVHGPKEHLWLPAAMVRVARRFRRARFLGDGDQVMSAVHVDDLAVLFCAALRSPSTALLLHGVAENLLMRDLAAAVQRGMGLPGAHSSMRLEVAQKIMRFSASWSVSHALKSDQVQRLRWRPRQPSVLGQFERVALLEAESLL